MNKKEILKSAVNQRLQDELMYHINIDNYRLAIEKIDREHNTNSNFDLAIQEYKNHIQELLNSSLIELRKTEIMREVIQDQLKELENVD